MTRATWGVQDAIIVFLVAQVGSAFWASGVAAITGESLGSGSILALFLAQLSLYGIYLVGPTLVVNRKGAGPVADLRAGVSPRDLPVGLAAGVVTQLSLIPLYIPIERLVEEDPSDAARRLFDRADGTLDLALLFVMVVVLAPLVEEYFYRGLLLRALQHRLGDVSAVVLSAALFSLAHFLPLQFPGLFVFGLVAGVLAIRFDRLGPCWFMHAAFNFVSYVQLVAER